MTRRGFLAALLAAPLAAKAALFPRPEPLTGYRFYISNDSLYSFGFTGFTPAEEDKIVGQLVYRAALVAPLRSVEWWGV